MLKARRCPLELRPPGQAPAIRRVSGVADVVSFGGAVKEYQVKVDPYRLRKFGVSIDQLSQALTNSNANTGAALFTGGTKPWWCALHRPSE